MTIFHNIDTLDFELLIPAKIFSSFFGRLAAGVAHEIRNPLSSIKGFATYFRDRYKDIPEDHKTAEVMVQEVERLNRVIGQLLEFARPMTIQIKSMNVHTLIQHSLKMIEREASLKKIIINKEIPKTIQDAPMDVDRINQVLLNLYLNAIEAMDHGGTLDVIIDRDTQTRRLQLTIADTGQGIEKKDLIHIFDPLLLEERGGIEHRSLKVSMYVQC